jgi:hypothetical protein
LESNSCDQLSLSVAAVDSRAPNHDVRCGMTSLLRTRISEILHYVWDPVSVSREPRARDEYDEMVSMVAQLLLERASGLIISSFLTCQAGVLGGRLDSDRDRRVAGLLIDWHRHMQASVPRRIDGALRAPLRTGRRSGSLWRSCKSAVLLPTSPPSDVIRRDT